MTRQALYLKWRPQTFDDVIGQDHIVRTLRNAIDSGRIRHAYLFSGPRGTGKTTTARLLAQALGSKNMDVIEIDAASHTGVDDVRDLRDKIAFMPSEGTYKVYIIDEAHRFSRSAFDALLKTLEEPPEHAIFVLATTEIDKVPDTIKSRCLQFEFRRVSLIEVTNRLQLITEAEGLNIDREALMLIARHGTGSVRDSISLLDQIVADPEEHITLEDAQRILGTASSAAVQGLATAILQGDVVNGLHLINQAMNSGSDPRQFGQQLVEHLRGVLLTQTASADLIEASDESRSFYAEQAAMVNKPALLRAIRIFNEAVTDQMSGWHPQLALELALVESIGEAPIPTPGTAAPTAAATIDVKALEIKLMQQLEARLARGQTVTSEPAPAPATPATPSDQPDPAGDMPKAVDAGTPSAVPLSQVQARWEEVKQAVKPKSVVLGALLDHAEVRGVAGNVVTLAIENEVFLERLGAAEHRQLINFVLTRLHGTPLKARMVLAGDNTQMDQHVDVDNPLIAAAQELGAKIESPPDDK